MENLRKIVKDTIESGKEDDVSSVALGLLEVSGKTLSNGYVIRAQHRITLGIPDITVEILHNKIPLIVIECKSKNASMSVGESQIIAYMVDGNYPHGILMSPSKVKYYHMEEIPEIIRTFFLSEDISRIVELLRDL